MCVEGKEGEGSYLNISLFKLYLISLGTEWARFFLKLVIHYIFSLLRSFHPGVFIVFQLDSW